MTAAEVIAFLKLQPHPKEGGFFRETYRSAESFAAQALPDRYGGSRSVSTAIYYLFTPTHLSPMHRLQSDEVFHFYAGDPVRMLHLFPDGTGQTVLFGSKVLEGQGPQVVVPRGVWQGAYLEPGGAFALIGCTVAPGFDYADYEHGNQRVLLGRYPAFAELISKLTSP